MRAGKDDALIAISFAPYRRSPSISPRARDGPERRSSSSPTARSPRFRRRHTGRSRSGGQMTPRETDPPGPTRKEPTGRAGAISRFFIERPVLSNVIALVVVLMPRRAPQSAERAISECRPANRAGHDALPRHQRPDGRRLNRAADRAAGQRRREHAIHAVVQRGRRHLYFGRHLRHRDEPRFGASHGAEPGWSSPLRRFRRKCSSRA